MNLLSLYKIHIISHSHGDATFRKAEKESNVCEHHGLDRCLDKVLKGFKRYCDLGVLAANLHKGGNVLQEKARKKQEKLQKAASVFYTINTMSHNETRKAKFNTENLHSIEVRPITRTERGRWDNLMRRHHYPGLHALIGETIRYVALYHTKWLALISWSAVALKCKVRDQWSGWHSFLQWKRLRFIANNSRFLIVPDVHIPNLASRVLALNPKRLSLDW